MFITYDLPGTSERPAEVRQAREVHLPGQVVRWQVGDYRDSFGTKLHGLRVSLAVSDEDCVEHSWIELPPEARNVQFHLKQLPHEYQAALKSAA